VNNGIVARMGDQFEEPDDSDDDGLLAGRTFQADTINLYTDEQGKEICAMIGKDPVEGIAGFGASVHEALHQLADGGHSGEDVQRSAMRALRAANPVRLCQFQDRSLDVSESYRPDSGAALVANDIRLISARVDYQTPAAVHFLSRHFHGARPADCRMPISYRVRCSSRASARSSTVARDP
jgi:hypothetical protein